MKQIVITEEENGGTSLRVNKGIKWSTVITGIEMMLESLLDNSIEGTTIDDILDDIKRIYLRDKEDK